MGDFEAGLGSRLLPLGGRLEPLGDVGERRPIDEFALVGDELPESESRLEDIGIRDLECGVSAVDADAGSLDEATAMCALKELAIADCEPLPEKSLIALR